MAATRASDVHRATACVGMTCQGVVFVTGIREEAGGIRAARQHPYLQGGIPSYVFAESERL